MTKQMSNEITKILLTQNNIESMLAKMIIYAKSLEKEVDLLKRWQNAWLLIYDDNTGNLVVHQRWSFTELQALFMQANNFIGEKNLDPTTCYIAYETQMMGIGGLHIVRGGAKNE